jgi:hypothetical protein
MITQPINPEMYKHACVVAIPCGCDAPIVYTCIYATDDETKTDDNKWIVGTTLFRINIHEDVIETLYDDIPHGADTDDLNMICTRCGKSWVPFNPLFF